MDPFKNQKAEWTPLLVGLWAMFVAYVLCYLVRYGTVMFVVSNYTETSHTFGTTGTELIEKASMTPIVIFIEVLTLMAIFGFSFWTLAKRQVAVNLKSLILLFLFGIYLTGLMRSLIYHPTIAAIEIPAAAIFAFLGFWLAKRRPRPKHETAINSGSPPSSPFP